MSDDNFINALNEAFYKPSNSSFGGTLETHGIKSRNFELPYLIKGLKTKRYPFNLQLQHSNNYSGERFALVGDAAH